MDILLIYPPLSVDERYGNRNLGKIGGHLPPLGLAYIASSLREKNFSVDIIDAPATSATEEDILRQIGALKPKVIGLSSMSTVFHRAKRLAEMIRVRFPEILTVIGGHHASILPLEVLAEGPDFDLLVYGEGEITVLDIMQKFKDYNFNREKFLADHGILESLSGIVFRKSGQIKMTPPGEHIRDLDALPYPAWDLLPMSRYIPLPNQYLNKPVIHMVSIRGCPFQCSFCSADSVFGRRIRSLSPERLVNMIQYAKKEFGVREVSFWDDCMTVNKKWILDFCQLLIKENVNVTWTCYSRVDTVTKEILAWMKKAGCWNIFYGFESGNQELLDMVGKNITLDQIRQVNQWTKEAGIEVRASFMIALPGETPEMARKTIDFAISLEPDYAQFSITTPFPRTRLYDDAKIYGTTVSKDYSKYNMWEPIFIPYGYKDKEEIEAIERMAARSFYFRPKYVLGRLRKIRRFSDLVRYFKGLRMAIGFLK